MAGKGRQSFDSVIRQIQDEPHNFDFFQVVHLLERQIEDSEGVESRTRRAEEVLSIRPNTSLACPTADLHELEVLPPLDVDDESDRYRLTVNFLGLYGVDSPLPDYYPESFVQDNDQDSLQRRLLDVFHQQIYWLLYRCWKKYRYYLEFRDDASDGFTRGLFAVLGLANDEVRGDLPFPALRMLPHVGILSRQDCTVATLEALIRDLTGVDVAIEQFVFTRVAIPADQQCKLGVANSALGKDMSIGEEVADRSSAIRLHFDGLDRETFESLLRGGARRHVVDAVLATCLSRSLDYEFVLQLEPVGDHAMVLGGDASGSLGRFAWLTARQDETLTARFAGGVQC